MLVLVCNNLTGEAWCEPRDAFDTPAELAQTTRCYKLSRHDVRYLRFVATTAAKILSNHPKGPFKENSVLHQTLGGMVRGADQLLRDNPSFFGQNVNIGAGQVVRSPLS